MRMLNPIKAGLVALLLSVLAACQSPPQGLTAEQIAALKEQGFHLTDEGWTLDISNKVLFANNVGALNPETRQVVEKLGKALIEVGLNRARVDGHTDSNGDEAYNQQLSERRAQSVANALTGIGMQAQNIKTRGLGSSQPVADNRTGAGRMENRRVSIVVASD